MELLQQMPDESVSMILTDPPYGISYQNNFTNRKHRMLEGDDGIDYEKFAGQSYRVLKENAHAYFLHGLTVTHIIMNVWYRQVSA